MSIARKLVLLAGMVLAALALTTSTAAAQPETEVEVVTESIHAPCPAQGCPIHMEGETTFVSSLGAPLITCHDEFRGVLRANGTGEVRSWVGSQHGAPGCTVSPCQEVAERHWPITVPVGELGNGHEHVSIEFCLFSPTLGADVHCTAEYDITDESTHHYRLSLTNHPCAGGLVRFSGNWEFEHHVEGPPNEENFPPIEIEHHDDNV